MPLLKSIQILGSNVRALRKSGLTPEGFRGINKFAKWTGVANGTIQRIEAGKTDPQVSHLAAIAAKYSNYGIQLWHLFVPGLDPMDLPAIVTTQQQAFHAKIERAYQELMQPDLFAVETKPKHSSKKEA